MSAIERPWLLEWPIRYLAATARVGASVVRRETLGRVIAELFRAERGVACLLVGRSCTTGGHRLRAAVTDIVVNGASTPNVFASNRIAFWWYSLQAIGVPALVSWAIPCLLVAVAVLCWRRSASHASPQRRMPAEFHDC